MNYLEIKISIYQSYEFLSEVIEKYYFKNNVIIYL